MRAERRLDETNVRAAFTADKRLSRRCPLLATKLAYLGINQPQADIQPAFGRFNYFQHLKAGHQQPALEDKFLGQMRVELHEKLLLHDDFTLPLLGIKRLRLVELIRS